MATIAEAILSLLISNITFWKEKFCNKKSVSPFNAADKTPSFSIYFDRNNNKWKFKDFSNGEQGDILDFCMKYKGLNPRDARKYLGLTVESTDEENQIKKITGYINWQIEHQDHMKGRSIKGIFPFTDANNNIVYFKVKFDCENGKKQIGYYHIKEDKVINKRGTEEEMIYNYHNMLEAKCSVLKDLIQNKEACDRYERLSHITNKIETIGGTRWSTSIKTMEV